ncbi:MAG: alpha/beta hydrolase [Pseudomonadota bacterium]
MNKRLLCCIVSVALTGCASRVAVPDAPLSANDTLCRAGVYGAAEPFVVITLRGAKAHYAFNDGRAGSITARGDVVCRQDKVIVGATLALHRRSLEITDTRFDAQGAVLAGQLLQPHDANADTPLIVYAHGSEELGWIEAAVDPYQMVARGVSVFVYDKRGTGKSTGTYSQNFPQLADDMVAASIEAKRLAAGRFGKFGVFGLSQGGWIAPLAADRAGADFIGIGYGLVVDILEEDAAQVALELSNAGFDADAIAKAKLLTDVTARLAVSGYSDGLDDLDRLREQYAEEAWYPVVRGGFTGVILGMTSDALRTDGIPMFDRLNIDWTLNPMAVLRDVDVPQLWILAEDDREAPYAKTLERLQSLRQQGKDISVFVFPDTDHGMWEYTQDENGKRTSTKVTDGFYRLMADWAKQRVAGQYGNSAAR